MAKKRKNFIREKRIYCGEEYLEVDIVAVTNMPEAGKGKKGKSSQAQKNLNDKRSKRRFVQIANTNFGTNDFHISATYNNEHLPMSLEEAEKNVHNYLDRIKRKMKRETGEDLKYMLVTEYTPEEEEGQLTLQGIEADDKTTKAVRIHHHIIINSGGLDRDDLELMWSTTRINWKKANDPEYRANVDYYGFVNCDRLQPNENGLEGIVNYINKRNERANPLFCEGVEKNKAGEVVAYHVSKFHPLSFTDREPREWVRVLAYGEKTGRRNILHIMNRERIGQVRGVPFLAPVIDTIKQLGRYTEAEVLAAVINGLFTVFIEKESASDDVPFGESIPEEMQVDQEDENSIELAPGAVIDLGEGEKANMVNPGRPNPNFDPFVIAVLKQIGAALEIPYEILIMAFSSNYSASRAAILEFFKVVKMYRAWFVADFCQPIYEEWLSEAVAKGRIKAPGFFTDPIIKDAYCSAEWTGPSAGQLDPTKEVEAAEKRVQGGYSTREREARELTGTDFYKNIKQRKREEELLKEVTGGAKTDAQTVENINGREESDTENNPDNDGGQTEEETEE